MHPGGGVAQKSHLCVAYVVSSQCAKHWNPTIAEKSGLTF
jgi:hypothetical protein